MFYLINAFYFIKKASCGKFVYEGYFESAKYVIKDISIEFFLGILWLFRPSEHLINNQYHIYKWVSLALTTAQKSCGFGHIYWKNGKLHFLLQWTWYLHQILRNFYWDFPNTTWDFPNTTLWPVITQSYRSSHHKL